MSPLNYARAQTITDTRFRVIDGDTILLGKLKIRLYGIDAPEINQSCQDKNNQEDNCGEQAKIFLENILANQKIICEMRNFDKYQRILAKCFVNNQDIQEILVKNGHAIAYINYSRDYEPAQSQAIKAQKGIWQGHFTNPANFRLNPIN